MSSAYQKITNWKQRWGTIHQVSLEGITCFYRSLTAWEFASIKELMSKNPNVDWDEVICSVAVVEPEECSSQFKLAGTFTTLSSLILEASVFTEESIEAVVAEAREWASQAVEENFLVGLALSIGNIYPGVDLLALLNEPAERLIRIAALVEHATKQPIFKEPGPKTMPLTQAGQTLAKDKTQQIIESTKALRDEINKRRKKK